MKTNNTSNSNSSNQQTNNTQRFAVNPKIGVVAKNNKKRNLFIGSIIISLILLCIFGTVFLQNHASISTYGDYLVKKYNFLKSDLKLISFEKEHDQGTGLSEGTMKYGKIHIPTMAIFKTPSGRGIQVIEKGGNISDNYQIRDISDIASKYFSNLLKYNVRFVEFRDTFNGDASDSELSDFIQSGNNYFVNDKNIEKLLVDFGSKPSSIPSSNNYSSDSTLTLYINLSKNYDINTVIHNINGNAMEFINKARFTKFAIWLYSDNEELSIINAKTKTLIDQSVFENYYVGNLKNIVAYVFYVDPNGNERNPNFDKNGNFYVDDRKIWFSHR